MLERTIARHKGLNQCATKSPCDGAGRAVTGADIYLKETIPTLFTFAVTTEPPSVPVFGSRGRTFTVPARWFDTYTLVPAGSKVKCRGHEPPVGVVLTKVTLLPPSQTLNCARLSWPRLVAYTNRPSGEIWTSPG